MSGETVRIPVGVVVERRKAKSEWMDFIWQPVEVLAGIPETEPWTEFKQKGETKTLYAGGTEIELFATETTYYRNNLATGEPLLWVILQPSNGEWPYELFKVTADPSEGEAMTETGTYLVETVPMPNMVSRQIADFIARYHVERPFVKRERDDANLEALGRNPAKGSKP